MLEFGPLQLSVKAFPSSVLLNHPPRPASLTSSSISLIRPLSLGAGVGSLVHSWMEAPSAPLPSPPSKQSLLSPPDPNISGPNPSLDINPTYSSNKCRCLLLLTHCTSNLLMWVVNCMLAWRWSRLSLTRFEMMSSCAAIFSLRTQNSFSRFLICPS